jgi:predicted DNA-binding protein YlxM (UPF0122 family)
MIMDSRIICRVMLYAYIELEDRCEIVDKQLYNTAVRSAFNDTMETCKEMERLTGEKIAYINTKVIIDNALITLKSKYEIEQHHIKGKSVDDIAEQLNVPSTVVIGRLRRQRERLYKAILNVYSGRELLDIICVSEWLMNRYKREATKQALCVR